MSSGLNRRQLLLAGGAAWLGAGAMGRVAGRSPRAAPRRCSSSPRARASSTRSSPAKASKPSLAEQILTEIGKEHGFEVVAIQGRPTVRARQDRPVGRLRLRDHRRPDHAGRPTRARRCRPTARRPSTTPSAAARASWACTAPPTPSATSAPRNKGAEDPYIQMIGGEFIIARRPAGSRDRDRRPRVPRHRQGIRQRRAARSRSRTNGTPSRTCPTTCT